MRDKLINRHAILFMAAIFLLSMTSYAPAKKGGKAIPAEICWETVEGDISIGSLDCCVQGIMHNTTQLVFKYPPLYLHYFQGIDFKKLGDGEACFSQGYYPDEGLAVVQERDGTAWARVWFWGKTNDGTTELKYGLHMYGTFDGDWPPKNDVTKPTYVHLNRWEMESEGKGKLKNVSCTGSGDFGIPLIIKVTREDIVN